MMMVQKKNVHSSFSGRYALFNTRVHDISAISSARIITIVLFGKRKKKVQFMYKYIDSWSAWLYMYR